MSSKYGDLIRQARKQENQKTGKPDSQKESENVSQPFEQIDSQTAIPTENQLAKKPDDQLTIKPDSQKAEKQVNQNITRQPEPEVNLCVKVPKSLRQHWAAEAKREGTTMTSVIVEALKEKFGMPEYQKNQ